LLDCESIIRAYLEDLRRGFHCVNTSDGRLRIATPYVYPDHDNIVVYIRERESDIAVSDLGETLRHVDMMGCDIVAGSVQSPLPEVSMFSALMAYSLSKDNVRKSLV
jgi:hypothetical protein